MFSLHKIPRADAWHDPCLARRYAGIAHENVARVTFILPTFANSELPQGFPHVRLPHMTFGEHIRQWHEERGVGLRRVYRRRISSKVAHASPPWISGAMWSARCVPPSRGT